MKAFLFSAFLMLLFLEITSANNFKSIIYIQVSQKNKKLIYVLKDKKGYLLGNVYIEDFKNEIFKKLLILKEIKGKKDTLYFIDQYVFKNPKGIDITFDKKTFNGYKIEFLKGDSFQLFGVGKGNSCASDPATIIWNYKQKIFEVEQAL